MVRNMRVFECRECGARFEAPFGTGRPDACPTCRSGNFYRAIDETGGRGRGGGRGRCRGIGSRAGGGGRRRRQRAGHTHGAAEPRPVTKRAANTAQPQEPPAQGENSE